MRNKKLKKQVINLFMINYEKTLVTKRHKDTEKISNKEKGHRPQCDRCPILGLFKEVIREPLSLSEKRQHCWRQQCTYRREDQE